MQNLIFAIERVILADGWQGICDPIFGDKCIGDATSTEGIKNKVIGYTNFFGGFAGFVGILIFIYGAVKLSMAGSDQEKIESARKTMVAAIVGLIVVIMTRVIIGLVLKGIGVV